MKQWSPLKVRRVDLFGRSRGSTHSVLKQKERFMTQAQEVQTEPLYRHTKRKEWGLAIMAWDREGRRAFQFEDGHLRVFAPEFQELIKEVAPPAEEATETTAALNRLLNINDQSAARAKKATARATAPLTLEDQIAVFVDMYPAGFQDPKWKQTMRGAGQKRRTKKFRDPAIKQAQEELSADRLGALLNSQQYGTVQQAVLDVLKKTNLVTATQIKPIAELGPGQQQAFAVALRDLLYADGPYDQRLGVFADRLFDLSGTRPTWQLATSIGGLVHPREQTCVSPSAFRDQAKWTAPRLEHSPTPQAAAYERLLAMVRSIQEELKAAGLVPCDLLDVHDFIRETLSPSARRRADVLRIERQRSAAADEDEAA